MFFGKKLTNQNIDLEWKVPEINGDEILPDPDYKLQSSEEELAAKIALEPSMGGILAGKHMARIVLEYFSPQLYQNLDEWVQGKDLTPIVYGPHRISVDFYVREWNRHCLDEKRTIYPGYYVFNKINHYIESEKLSSLYDFWRDVIIS